MKPELSWLSWTEKDQGNSKAVKKNGAEPRQTVVLSIIFISETLSDTADLATATLCHYTLSPLPQGCPLYHFEGKTVEVNIHENPITRGKRF